MVKSISPVSEKDLSESNQDDPHEKDKRHSSLSTLHGYVQKLF